MLFAQNLFRRRNTIATRLAAKLFDQRLISNQFRTAYLVEMIEPVLRRYGWCATGELGSGWHFEHSGGCRLKVLQSAAIQSRPREHKLETRPVFGIRARGKSAPRDANGSSSSTLSSPDIYLIGWHPVLSVGRVDHRKPTQWQFFVLPSRALPQGQRTLGLARVRELAGQEGDGAVSFSALAGAIEGCRLRARTETAVRANEARLRSEPDCALA